MPSSRYTPSTYGDIDSGGWDNPLPRPHKCKTIPYWQLPSRGFNRTVHPSDTSDPDGPGRWEHGICQFCGYVGNSRSISDTAPTPIQTNDHEQIRGRGSTRAPSTDNDNWAPAPVRNDPVRIEPPQNQKPNNDDGWGQPSAPIRTQVGESENKKNDDGWGQAPTRVDESKVQDHKNDDGGDWGPPARAPSAPAPRSNGNHNNNNFSTPPPRPQNGHRSRYDDDEDYNEDDEVIPTPSADPPHGAYIPWTGVT